MHKARDAAGFSLPLATSTSTTTSGGITHNSKWLRRARLLLDPGSPLGNDDAVDTGSVREPFRTTRGGSDFALPRRYLTTFCRSTPKQSQGWITPRGIYPLRLSGDGRPLQSRQITNQTTKHVESRIASPGVGTRKPRRLPGKNDHCLIDLSSDAKRGSAPLTDGALLILQLIATPRTGRTETHPCGEKLSNVFATF